LAWIKGTKLYSELVTEVELHAQNAMTYGLSLLQITWEREIAYKNYTITLLELMQAASQSQNPIYAILPQMILEEGREAEAAAILGRLYDEYVETKKPRGIEWTPRPMKKSRAMAAVRELRNTCAKTSRAFAH
jgi:hypothetical protein